MADKSDQLVLEGLGRAVADPDGQLLHGSKRNAGLFAATTAGKQAAERCKDEGWLRVVRTETKGKSTSEVCAITEKGLAYLLRQVSPKQVLEDFLRVLTSRQGQVDQLLDTARRMHASLDALKAATEKVLQQIEQPTVVGPARSINGCDSWASTVAVPYLTHWHDSGATEDCPLPDLYRQARQVEPHLTLGRFHDGLRRLHEEQQIYLHPWTGPLYDLPEPSYALLVGHEIAYYVSLRR